ncbi:CFI-box-CTERM domain-containing protein [Alkalicoccus chagannorensis]|uniref:CFI-box-CTERM domain-containing protein n=1 Tax=Alkalicoccus chagannorensis TaxID=427072 RepID=UPI0005505717|nr:CFI-box-CTERM domain-containing protein [Alkalicoccus chagannorensis]
MDNKHIPNKDGVTGNARIAGEKRNHIDVPEQADHRLRIKKQRRYSINEEHLPQRLVDDTAKRPTKYVLSAQKKENESSCFVATAAFEGAMEKEVLYLRRFREQVLRPTNGGRVFIKVYEFIGPVAANYIRHKPRMKKGVRHLLIMMINVTKKVWRH